MQANLTFGEYMRRRRRDLKMTLQALANVTGASYTHLSRIESNSALPNAETVTKLAKALDGDLRVMLEMAECLPREILERIKADADQNAPTFNRPAYQESDDTKPPPAEASAVFGAARSRGLDEGAALEVALAFDLLCAMGGETREALIGMMKTLGTKDGSGN